MGVKWNDDGTVSVDPPKRPKKLTGTRLASVLGLNRWSTPFQVWCEVTRACSLPFEDTKFTIAGKAIEPKQIAYMRRCYGFDNLRDPTDVYGPDYFKKTYGNFFQHKVFGGMWDAIAVDGDGRPETVFEFKTTKRSEDWEDGIPEYYALQAALYAWLLEVDDVVMVVSFLSEGDYEDPGAYEPSASNTATFEFSMAERYPNFEATHLAPALEWWEEHVLSGRSPRYDESADSEYLALMRKESVSPGTDDEGLLRECASLMRSAESRKREGADDDRRLAAVKAELRQRLEPALSDAVDTAEMKGCGVVCKLVRSERWEVDEGAMERDGVLDKYLVKKVGFRFAASLEKEGM